MNRYTKIMENLNGTTKSSDLSSSQKTQKVGDKFIPNPTLVPKPQEIEKIDTSLEMMEDRDEFTDRTYGAIKFQRNRSVSSSTATSTTLKQIFAVKRALSMGRSSSVSERYCRIHNQHEALASPFHDGAESVNQKKMKPSSGKRIFRACKRIFRFQ